MKNFLFLPVLLILAACNSGDKKTHADEGPRRIELLFLGHEQEHHNSRAYMPILANSLTSSGINITYTEKVEDLNLKNLETYDGLIIYANHESISPAQEKALLKYVSGGHAFIPIHSASFCFKNSPEYIDLVGGQFMEHKTGTFTADIIKKEHPAIKAVTPFSTWDETYVHDKLSKDITVLMERAEGDHREPWTWVKEHGKGRVFYTAYGHDERTWNHPEFQNLIKEGILWAIDDNLRKNLETYTSSFPKLAYREMADIPNYEKRDPPPRYQMPLTPEESAKLIQVPPGFRLELFASEPDIINPIDMNWDEKGRLWVIETVDYPNTVRDDKGLGDDRIKICEDTDGDGRADKFTVFADQLNIPTSFAFVDGGIVVSQAPNFLFLKDTNGDDKADVKEIMMDGWGVFDTHAGPSNLVNGIDNSIYGVVGYSGFKGTIFDKPYEFRQGVYRFNPKSKEFEFLTNTSNNTWGIGITEDNSIFASTANNTHSVFMGIPNRLFSQVQGITIQGSKKIDGHYAMRPITPNVRQVDVFGGFTAAAGHHFYTARDFPASYSNKVAFVCEPTGGVVHIAEIVRDGAGYLEKDGGNLFASSDEWVSPVSARVGPDGAVWVLDWYNFIVQHNPTPTSERGGYDAVNGKGNAYENPLRDRSKGRIWRVFPKTADTVVKVPDLSDTSGMIKALSNDNMLWRLHAQRLLVEREKTDVLGELYKLVNNGKADTEGLYPGALHALWTIEGLGAVSNNEEARSVVRGALFHSSAALRKAAAQILPGNEETDNAILDARLLEDKDPGVQLEALLYFAERGAVERVGQLAYDLSQMKEVKEDPWLSQAVYLTASRNIREFVDAFRKKNPRFRPVLKKVETEEAPVLSGDALAETFVSNYYAMAGGAGADAAANIPAGVVITIGTIENEMKYNLTEFVVDAGSQVELVFENTDFMQHNLVITTAGDKEKVGLAADKLAADPAGAEKNYIPEMPEVLFATPLVNPEERFVLRFTAPSEPGMYPYICTFPGHWRIMQGMMKVVASKT